MWRNQRFQRGGTVTRNTHYGPVSEESKLRSDGGEKHGKAAPPEDILAAPSNQLNTEPHPQAVTEAIVELLDAADILLNDVDRPRDYGVDPTSTTVEQLTALSQAVHNGELTIEVTGASGDEADPVETLQSSVREVRNRTAVTDRSARRLLEDLEAVESRQQSQLTSRLDDTIKRLEEYRELQTALGSVSPRDEPRVVGQELLTEFDDRETDHADRLADLGRTLQQAANDRETARSDSLQLEEVVEEIVETASEQTHWEPNDSNTTAPAPALAEALDTGTLWFLDDRHSIDSVASAVESTGVAQSKPAREFLETVRNTDHADERELKRQLRTAVKAIDRTETVTTRLKGVDPDALTRTADRLLEDLATLSVPTTVHIQERIEELKKTAAQSNDADPLTLYAARQELQYYDRTLIPNLSDPVKPSAETDDLSNRLDRLEQRRSEMRQSYPSEYPDCDHTIPIYFFDLVSNLLTEAEQLHARDETDRAAGLADASEQLLEWITGMYETHSYFVLLQELRG